MNHRKLPARPDNTISQAFNDGVVEIYSTVDVAQSGYQPQLRLVPEVTLHYAERAFGVQRNYTARQNNIQIEKVIRCLEYGGINNQDVAVIRGVQYRIDTVTIVPDVYPRCVDLTLARMEQIPEARA